MENRLEGGEVEKAPASRRGIPLFVAALGAYYALYYWIFVVRVGEYFGDVLKHFAFVRRLIP